MRSIFTSLFFMLAVAIGAYAQTTVTTTHTNNNGSGSVTFNVQNTNAFDIIVTDVQCHLGTNAANNLQLLYRTTPLTDNTAPWDFGTIGVGQNGWLSAGTAVVNSNTANGIVSAITGMSVTVPAGQTYEFGFSGTTIQYMTLTNGAGTNTFSAGGVNIITGDGISWGGSAYPSTPVNYPRGFIGGITFVPGVPCTAPPTGGTTAASVNPVCPSVATLLTLTGASQGTGMSYQWQSSTDGITYTNIAGATQSSYSATQTVNTYYQCILTCSSQSSTSTPILVNTNTFLNCYCTSNATSTADEEILNVSIGTMSNSSTCSTTGGAGSIMNQYSNYTATVTPPLLAASASYPFSVQIGTCGGNYSNAVKIFIDYNQNGLFTDPGENVYTSATTTVGPHTESGNIIIPASATVGLTRMRVVNVETSPASINACGTYSWGETEDYFVNIAPVPTCPQPTALSLVTADLSSATLQWTAGGAETSWQIEYGPQGFTQGTGTFVTTSTNPHTLTSLAPNSFYQAYVRGICGPGDTSYWAGIISWNTYGQGQYMEWDNACGTGFFDISGTGVATNLTDDAEIGLTLPFPFLLQGALMTNVTIADNGGIILGTQTGDLTWSNGAIATAPANALVAFWDDIQNQFGNIYYQTIGTAPNQKFIIQWDNQSYYFGVAGEEITYQIVLDQATNEIYYFYDDAIFGGSDAAFDNGASATIGINGPNQDIQVSLNNSTFLANNSCAHFYYTDCPKPTTFAISYITADEVAFTWSAGLAAETNWTVIYGPDGFDPATSGTTITTTTASATLPGLTQLTQYDVYIYADCTPAIQSNGLTGTFMTYPLCSNPTGMTNSVDIDSIYTSWSWTESSPAYPSTGFNVAYGMSGFNPYTQGTEVNFDNNLTDTIADVALLGGGVYQLYVQAVCGSDTSQYIGPFTVTMPLSNDTVCGAETLMADGTVYTFNNSGALVQTGETAIAPPATGAQTTTGWINSTLNNTTWFKFVAPASGNVRVNNTAINYAGQAAVYEATNCSDFATFALIAANDNAIGGTSVAPNFTVCGLTPGVEYYLMHDGSTATVGNYSISITPINLNAGAFANIIDVCAGDTVNLFNGITGQDAGGVWTAELASAGTGVTDSLFASAGLAFQIFNFEYRLTDGCAYDSIIAQVEIYGPSSAGQDGTLTVCRNEPIDLLAGLSGNVDFGGSWYNPSNQLMASSEIIASNIPGQFNYDYITGNGVCPDDTANVLLNVDPSCDHLDVSEKYFGSISMYPNPTNGIVFISNEGSTEVFNYEVTDVEGRVIASKTAAINGAATTEINLKGKVTGMYLIRVYNDNAEKVFRVILQ